MANILFDLLPEELLGELFFLLDPPSVLSLSLCASSPRAAFNRLRPRLAPGPDEAALDEALDPYRLTPAFLEECVKRDYVALLEWALEASSGALDVAWLVRPFMSRGGCGFFNRRLERALACSPAFLSLPLLKQNGMEMKEVLVQAIDEKHPRVLELVELAGLDVALRESHRILAPLVELGPASMNFLTRCTELINKRLEEGSDAPVWPNWAAYKSAGAIGSSEVHRRPLRPSIMLWLPRLPLNHSRQMLHLLLKLCNGGPTADQIRDADLAFNCGLAQGGHIELLRQRLLEPNADATLLFQQAVMGNQIETLRFLQSLDPATSLLSNINFAAGKGGFPMFRYLLSQGMRPPSVSYIIDCMLQSEAPVHEQIAFIEEAIRLSPNPPPLLDIVSLAIFNDLAFETVIHFLDRMKPSDISSPSESNGDPILLAAVKDDVRLLNLLLSRGFTAAPDELLLHAFHDQMYSMRVAAFLMKKFKINLTPELSRRLVRNSSRAVGWLLKRGVDLNGINVYRNLFFTEGGGIEPVIETLLQANVSWPFEEKKAMYLRCRGYSTHADFTLLVRHTSKQEALALGLIYPEEEASSWPPDTSNDELLERFRERWPDEWEESDINRGPSPPKARWQERMEDRYQS